MLKAVVVSGVLAAISHGKQVYLYERFEEGSDLRPWTYPDQEHRDDRTHLFSFDRGNNYEPDSSIGLYTRYAASKYVTSYVLPKKLDGSKSNFAVEFKVKQEKGQLCGDAQISLFGNTGDNNQ